MTRKNRKRVQVSDPVAEVRISPVRVNGHQVTHKGVEIQLDDGSWEAINIHSNDYNLVPNADADRVAKQILADSAYGWEKKDEIWTGRYWAALYQADSDVEAPSVGDALSLGLRVENSYDGSCQFRLILMAYVLSCSNGLVVPQHFANYRMRHTMNNEFDTAEAVYVLNSGMEQVVGLLPKIDELSRTPLTLSLLSRVAKETSIPKRDWGYIAENIGDASNAWDLMQAITHRLTHYGRGRSSLHYQEEIGNYFMGRIVQGIPA
ncbi:MAG: hypothetical protein AVO35_10400 [Candidatus Aegiribacteria sp. MLS_C]|nr:MAG: hypothetical protein AVO35_10400 [Candidatus Aegiribacteria sp. MLS_C]